VLLCFIYPRVWKIRNEASSCPGIFSWWREGKDELATHSMTTEVWISTGGGILEATHITIQEALEAENSKYTPSFGTEDLEKVHRLGTEAGLLGIYSFPGAVYATDGSNDKGVMGAGFYRLGENRGECCQLGRDHDDCFYYHSWRNSVVIAFETLSSSLT